MFQKIDLNLVFSNKRNRKLITPCCNKMNKDGKFVNYKNLPSNFGYCHSCGQISLPPTRYKDEYGNEYTWNTVNKTFKPVELQMYHKNVPQMSYSNSNAIPPKKAEKRYVDFNIVAKFYHHPNENPLLHYLRNTYGDTKTELVKQMYLIGTSKDNGTIFWNINIEGKVQKAKVSYYNSNGKRTNKFKVPYKNEDGYYSCLFGEHLLNPKKYIPKPIMLVESEKTALVSSIFFPEYTWLAYGGINALTDEKLKPLVSKKIVIVPDMSKNAVVVMEKKAGHLKSIGIDVKIWDMTNGKTDEQLKNDGWYNCDLEDVFRTL